MTISLKHEGSVSRIILDRPAMNLLDIDAMKTLVEAHLEADAHESTRVIVTESAVPNVFSNGLDPAYVLRMDPAKRPEIFEWVGEMVHKLWGLGKPHICAVTGPAMAGGAIIAITADFRIFDSENGRMSFSEPKVGLPIPRAVSSVIAEFCAKPMLREVVVLGKNMDAEFARRCGIADAVASGDQFKEILEKQIDRLARLSPAVLRETKVGMRQHLYGVTSELKNRDASFHKFVGNDFLGEGLLALVEKRFPNFPH